MNGLDIILGIILIWGIYSGFKKGFVVELFSSLLLFFGLAKGISLFYTLLPMLMCKLPSLAPFLPIFLAILMFLIGGGLIYVLPRLFKAILTITFLGIIDNLLGAFFGLCKSAFFISLLIYFWHYMGLTSFPAVYIDGSELFPLLEPIVPKILRFLPEYMQQYATQKAVIHY